MTRPDVEVPRAHWPDYFERITREARQTPTVVECLNRRRSEPAVLPAPLERISYDPEVDEVTISVEGASRLSPELLPRRLRHPVAVWVDAPEDRCPELIVIRAAARPSPVAVLLNCTAPATASRVESQGARQAAHSPSTPSRRTSTRPARQPASARTSPSLLPS